jgi:hypothetical protein
MILKHPEVTADIAERIRYVGFCWSPHEVHDMAGLLLKYTGAPKRPDAKSSAILVNLAPYFVTDLLQRGPIELAWAKPRARRGCFQLVEPQRWLVIEGNPDRFPNPGELVSTWLESRWGSFRGLEVKWNSDSEPAYITAFVDPWASRPLYYSSIGDALVIADKVATIAANQEDAEVEWASVLEAMLCGSVYSGGVSLKKTTALRPGEEIRFVGPMYRDSNTRPIPGDPEISEGLVRSNPASALRRALAESVAYAWREPDTYLLLTGGLDSRFVLALGGPGRRAIHVNIHSKDAEWTREIAAADNCQLQEFDLSEGHYLRVIEQAYLLTGAMFDSRFAWQLGFGAKWWDSGIAATLNAYLFDTLLKGYFFVPYQKYPYRDSALFSLLGPLAHSMRTRNGRFSGYAADMVFKLLRPEAQQLGKQQLCRLPDMFPQVIVDGMDISFEKLVLSNIGRQIHYPVLLGWFEETQAYTPAFHPALWSWYAASSIEDRRDGRALRQALASLKHPVCRIPDVNTGLPIEKVSKSPLSGRLGLRNYFVFSRLRDSLRQGRPADTESKTTPVGRDIRMPEGQKIIRKWIDRARDHAIFDANGLDRAWSEFQAGDDRAGETLLLMIGALQWEDMVKHHDSTDAFRYHAALPN